MLNSDLDIPMVAAPELISLPEVVDLRDNSPSDSAKAAQSSPTIKEVTPRGLYIGCPNCEKELRVSRKFLGQLVQCNFCSAPFDFSLTNPAVQRYAVYGNCIHCQQEIRVAEKYVNRGVACKHCDGPIRVLPILSPTT
ncbi:MAG: hypothetical protein R3C01_04975 [Planctomycetaceae bacterium]